MKTLADIARARLAAHHLTGDRFANPAAAVRWFGAVQAQDYLGAAWAVGQRTAGATAATIDEALTRGEILRTPVMRPTWHFVAPQDIRWLLALTASRVRKAIGSYERHYGLDPAIITRGESIITSALRDGQRLTKTELIATLKQHGLAFTNTLAYGHIMLCAELDALICSGGRRGKQQTYALLDERVPSTGAFDREAALTELAGRYFTSHGPPTIADFAWWSGLTMTDAKRGLRQIEPEIQRITVEETTYWQAGCPEPEPATSPLLHLLPNYDELLVAYKDRRAVIPANVAVRAEHPTGNLLFSHVIIRNGQVIGTWKRMPGVTDLELQLFLELNDRERDALTSAVERTAAFLNRKRAPTDRASADHLVQGVSDEGEID